VSEKPRAPLSPSPFPLPSSRGHGLLILITCSRDGTIETRAYQANIPLNAPRLRALFINRSAISNVDYLAARDLVAIENHGYRLVAEIAINRLREHSASRICRYLAFSSPRASSGKSSQVKMLRSQNSVGTFAWRSRGEMERFGESPVLIVSYFESRRTNRERRRDFESREWARCRTFIRDTSRA